MSKALKEFWNMVAGKHGAVLASIVIIAIMVIAFYLGSTPNGILDWMGK